MYEEFIRTDIKTIKEFRNDIKGEITIVISEKSNNKNAAQIFFLENGGPKNDFHNMDVDGEGFACNWDPAVYRKIERINNNNEPKN